MTRIGILSDTHLTETTESFRKQVARCFNGVDIILHAGDLTERCILDAFADKEVHAVHGNMCGYSAAGTLPATKTIRVNGFTIGLAHGNGGPAHTIEARLWNQLGPADCIVYGHTHHPVCHRAGPVLFINPGRFACNRCSRSAGTYAILELDRELRGTIHTFGESD
jgi:putative phosphoesterase